MPMVKGPSKLKKTPSWFLSSRSLSLWISLSTVSQIFVFSILYSCVLHNNNVKNNDNENGKIDPFSSWRQHQLESFALRKRRRGRRRNRPQSDGTFNGYPIYKVTNLSEITNRTNPYYHCVGDNYRPNAYLHRSCHFRNLCFNTSSQEYVLLVHKQEQENQHNLYQALHRLGKSQQNYFHLDTGAAAIWNASFSPEIPTVAIGGVNEKWTWKHGVPRLEWFPQLVEVSHELLEHHDDLQIYTLEPNVVMLPFHSFAGFNPGHLVWDDFLPLYTLLEMFDLSPSPSDSDPDSFFYEPLLMRYVLPPQHNAKTQQRGQNSGLWATCDFRPDRHRDCRDMFDKFLPLFGLSSDLFSTNLDARLELKESTGMENGTVLVCASHGAAGMGMLTDHGLKLHGAHSHDYQTTHNHARGKDLYDFRNFMVDNLFNPKRGAKRKESWSSKRRIKASIEDGPFVIVFSQNSSTADPRSSNFLTQIKALDATLQRRRKEQQQGFLPKVEIHTVTFSEMSLYEQVDLVRRAHILITFCGGGAVTATFLPKDSAIILFYEERGGVESNIDTFRPSLLDWDMFNHMSYIRVHWLPSEQMDKDSQVEVFVALVEHELRELQVQREEQRMS